MVNAGRRRGIAPAAPGGAAATAAGLAAAALVTGCGHSSRLGTSATSHRPPARRRHLLNHSLAWSTTAIAAYTAATPLLRGHEHSGRQALPQRRIFPTRPSSWPDQAAPAGRPTPPPDSYDFGHPRGPAGRSAAPRTRSSTPSSPRYLQVLPQRLAGRRARGGLRDLRQRCTARRRAAPGLRPIRSPTPFVDGARVERSVEMDMGTGRGTRGES